MTFSLTRPVLHVDPAWALELIEQHFSAAISGAGPALAFGLAPARQSLREVDAQVAIIVPTSGSGGLVKQVALSAAAVLASARASLDYLLAPAGAIWNIALPFTHIAAVNVLARAYLSGTALVRGLGGQYTAIVPAQLHNALNGDEQLLKNLTQMSAVLVGGQQTSFSLRMAAKSHGINVITTYGMSEMSGGCIYDGQALPGVELTITDDSRIALAGAMQALGYLNAPELWRNAKKDKWFITNDSGELISGKLNVLGRIDAVIKSGGEQVNLDQVEALLRAQNLGDFAAIGVADPKWGEKVVIAHTEPLTQHQIAQLSVLLKTTLGPATAAKEFYQIEQIDRGAMGKTNRAQIRQIINALGKPQ